MNNSNISGVSESDQHPQTLQRAVLWMVLLNAFTTPLMLSAANIALPAIADDLGLSANTLSWIPLAYLMASAMFVLMFGRLADNHGRKRIFLLGTAAVIASSLFAASAVGAGMLLAARFLQGVSAAMLYATQTALVISVYPPHQRGRIIGLLVAVIYIGLAAGPLLGGVVIDLFGWRAAFLLQVPLALIVLAIGIGSVRPEWRAEKTVPFDLPGAITYSTAILLLCLGVSRLPAPDSSLLLGASAAMILWFVKQARRSAAPLWDVRLFFSNRVFTFSCAASLIMYSATYANVVLLSLYLQYLKDLPATMAGLLIMVQPLSMAILSPIAGRLSDRIEPRLLASAGMLLTAVGLGMLATLSSGSPLSSIVLALLITGAGFSLFSSPNVSAIMGSVPQQHYSGASAAVATTRLLGQLNSMVLVTLVLTLILGGAALSPDNYPLLERSIRLSFTLAALICLPAIALSLARGRIHADIKP
ncbi:MAG: MFS transporter [Pseudomonadales bacterium]|nr:MFS transporter [Pseudomonadales bacterium]